MSLLRRIVSRLLTCPARVAVVDDEQTYTFARLILGAYHTARLIRRSTSNPHVGVMLPTSGAFPMAMIGCWLNRRAIVPLNYLLNKDELAHVINDSGIDTIITIGKMIGFVGEDAIPAGIKLIKLEEEARKFKGMPPLFFPPNAGDDELAALLYTSGTSGKPKGVMLTHGNLEFDVAASITAARITSANAFLGVLPQFHSYGLTGLTLLPLLAKAKVIYTARFMPKRLFDMMREHRPDVFIAIPSMYGAMLAVKSAKPEDVASIRYAVSGGEALPETVFNGWKDKLGLQLMEGYGLTETSPVANWSTPWDNRHHSVGKPIPGVRNLIVDEHNNVLGADEEGEILIAGPNVMKGYHNLPDLTEEVMTEVAPPGESQPIRAFRTGDIGKVDADGFLYITGRKKEMLIIGGENVFPREIEEVLIQYPGVAACAVIGKHDDTRGEVPIAFVELAKDTDAEAFDPAAARNFLRERIAQFKVPREVRVMDKLPRNPTGKILRRELKAE